MKDKLIQFFWRRRTAVFAFGPIIMLLVGRPDMDVIVLGLPFVIIGQLVRFWAAGHLTKMGRVVTSGPFGHVRNPLYCGSFLILIGICIMMNRWAFVPFFLAAFAAFHLGAALWEERILKELFGQEFEDYCKRVPRCFPRLRSRGGPGRFSFRQVLANKEPGSALATAIMVILFGIRAVLRG